jgi:hypothetical protein
LPDRSLWYILQGKHMNVEHGTCTPLCRYLLCFEQVIALCSFFSLLWILEAHNAFFISTIRRIALLRVFLHTVVLCLHQINILLST